MGYYDKTIAEREDYERAVNKSESEEQRFKNLSNLYRNKQINSKKEAEEYISKAEESENSYYSKSLKGISESLVSKGDAFIKKFFWKTLKTNEMKKGGLMRDG